MKKVLMIRVNGHITLSSKLKSILNERKLKQNTHLKQDLCSGNLLADLVSLLFFVFFSRKIKTLSSQAKFCQEIASHLGDNQFEDTGRH